MKLVAALVLLSPAGALAQYSFSCLTSIGTPALIRAEGRTERVSDVVLTCSGGNSGVGGSGNITLSFGTNVTSQVLVPASSASEALLLIDELQQTPIVGVNVFQGVVAGNQVTFNNVPFIAPGNGTRTFRMTNLRILATAIPAATPIIATISVSGSSSLPINNPLVPVGFAAPGLQFAVQGADGSAAQSLSFSGSANPNLSSAVLTNRLQFSEGFQTSFRKRNAGTTPANPSALIDQATPGKDYGTETGFYLSTLPSANGLNTAGLASQGTRLLATFSNVPAGVTLYVTTAPLPGTGSPSAALVSTTDASGGGGFVAAPATNTIALNGTSAGIAPVSLSGGTGTAVWEVLDTNPNALETYTFGVVAQYSSVTGAAQVAGSLAPVSSVTTADSVAPLPRFGNSSLLVPSQCAGSPCLQTLPTAIALSQVGGSADPNPVTLQVGSTGAPLSYAVSVTSTQGGWISVTPTSGTTPSSLQVTFTLGHLPASIYQATITLSSPNSLFPPVSIPVILTVSAGSLGAGPLACSANVAVPPQMRSSGMTEALGDIVLTCVNGTPTASGAAVPAYDVQVTLPTPITSRTYANGWSDALLIVDEPGSGLPGSGPNAPQVACATATGICPMTGNGTGITYVQNVFPGRVSGNTVTFPSIPFDPPGSAGVGYGTNTTRVFRITNLRADVSGVTVPTQQVFNVAPFSATVSTGPIPLNYQYGYNSVYPYTNYIPNGPTVVTGFVEQDVSVSTRTPDGSAVSTGWNVNQCSSTGPQRTGVLRFSEQFPTAFKPRTAPTSSSPAVNPDVSPAPKAQNLVGDIYNSESTFYTPSLTSPNVDFTTVGLANFGTRLRAQIANVPAGSRVWVSTLAVKFTNGVPAAVTTAAQNTPIARAVQSETGAFAPLAATTTLEGIPAVELTLVNGAGSAVWEVLQSNPNAQEDVDFLIWVQAGSAVSTAPATVTGSLAPAPPAFADSGSHQASSTLPVPRFTAGAASMPAFTVANCAGVIFNTAPTLPDGQATVPYSQTLSATGVPPYSFAVTAGSLPGGLSLSSGGALSGTPTVAGDFSFTITVTDHAATQASGTFSLHIATGPAPPSTGGISAENASPAYYAAFDASFSDPLGAGDLSNLAIWFTQSTASAANSCQISYDPVARVFGLLDDTGQTVLHAAAGTALIRNSQCIVDLPNSSASLSISPLLRVSVRFLPAFAGVKNVYSLAASNRGVDSGWQPGLTWTVGAAGAVSVALVPTSGSGFSQTFTLQATDAAGTGDIQSVAIWLGNSAGGIPARSCSISYSTGQFTFGMQSGASEPVSPGAVYHNQECVVDGSRLSASASGNTLTLTIPITFQAAFHGTWNIYTASASRNSPIVYQGPLGTFTVPTLPTPALQPYVSPNPATFGQPVTLSVTLEGSQTPAPTGKVTFYDGVTVLGTASLMNGQASVTTSLLPVGTRWTDFYYSGDSNWAPYGRGFFYLATVNGVRENTFRSATYAGGAAPSSAAIGDFDGDGNLDLLVPYELLGTIRVLLGKGDGTFQVASSAVGFNHPTSVTPGDFNGDGITDIAITSPTVGLVVMLGNGDGSFRPAPPVPYSGSPGQVAVGDFDGDGNADLAYADASGSVLVNLGNGDGTFELPISYTLASGASFVAVGDFNRDSNADLAVANSSANTVSILFGNGNGTFQSPVTLYPLASPTSITLADFNGDGYQDLAVGGGSGVCVFLSGGNGTFRSPVNLPIGAVGSLVAGRFTGTGKIDLAVSNTADHQVEILPGNGDGTFQPSQPYAAGSYPDRAIVAADFNGDGRADLAFVSGTANNVGVLLGSFQPMLTVTETHTGNFTPGQNGATYTITVSNMAAGTLTNGTVTVTEAVPAGMTLVSMAGVGWTCPSGGTSCTRSDILGGGFSYPPITVTVNVSSNPTTPLTNQVTVSGGGSFPATASDVTIVQVPTTTTVQSSASPSVVNQAVTFIATVTPSAATGTVQFLVDGTSFGTPVTVSGGTAISGPISTLAAGSHTVTANFTGSGGYGASSGTAGQTVSTAFSAALSGEITTKQGPPNARIWTFNVMYTGAGTASAAQISGVTFTQTGLGGGQACTPAIATPFPVQLGNIASGSSVQGSITVDFSSCANAAQFSVEARFSANNGALSGSILRNHEYR